MIVAITKRVHLDIWAAADFDPVVWELDGSTYVESLRPFRGYWLSLAISVWRLRLGIYLGE